MTDLYKILINNSNLDKQVNLIAQKIIDNTRISTDEALVLWNDCSLSFLGFLADYKNNLLNKNIVFYNKNIHIEPTNICIHNCLFCSYSHHFSEAFELNFEQIKNKIKNLSNNITEVHITGAVHPDRDIFYYADMLNEIKKINSNVHIKAFSAVEIDYMCKKSNIGFKEGLEILIKSGLNSLPGGGAEIFDNEIRNKICKDKTTTEDWLEIHKTAHKLGLSSNATMLYGHVENIENRLNHLKKIRDLQDETNGFNAFIPLKFKKNNNSLQHLGEVNLIEDLKNYAISRIFLDNIKHLKAYWPMIGKQNALLSLSFGVNDLDGTINDSTQIYSLAGAEDQNPIFNEDEIIQSIKKVNKIPIERDSNYNMIIK